MKQDFFKRQLKEIQNQVLEASVSNLSLLTEDAIAAFYDGLQCDNIQTRVKTATHVIENTLKLRELLDIDERLEVLEKHFTEEKSKC